MTNRFHLLIMLIFLDIMILENCDDQETCYLFVY